MVLYSRQLRVGLTTIQRERIFVFSWQQWLPERATMSRYTYIAYLFLNFSTFLMRCSSQTTIANESKVRFIN
jgi:hypothetical protein